MGRIMIVDDDNYIRELVSTLLINEGFSIYEATNGRVALQKFSEEIPDLCIIDIMMPKMDGFELCQIIRQNYQDIPILMLTADGEISQKIKGFERGIDDYLTKPFEAPELILRVKALLRRYKIISSQSVQIGTLTIDKNSYTICTDNEKMDIPMKEFELLFKLAGTPGKTFPRDQLIEGIWGYDFEGNERTLDVHVNRLRERFPAEQYGFKITTVRGLGYRLEVLT
ncbi:response regulator transcription factor [Desulfosporosinus fructosivorans]|uniref:Heme response regulator HssR n=1 Tax=Desulfosporosinus fructosivorans TaxID=2018669 RepID=A0A4Z0QXI9_9FIRM|nr:response regulator transcription factor [Desulfosporosinus fructosivorans]TGE35521.1 response regulator transcription factor [Desulfosporosinus fructosivorans]